MLKISRIGIAAASSTFDKSAFEKGVAVLRSLGFEIKYSDRIFDKEGYLAGSDKSRAEELNGLFADNSIDAIMFARGGYGIQRIMHLLDYGLLKKKPKVIIGFSDLTPLLNQAISKCGVPVIYGPVVTMLTDGCSQTARMLKKILSGTAPVLPLNLRTIKKGSARGPLMGGCLTMLSTSIGTSYEVNLKNSILFLEDTNEKIYKYDRMLTHLKNAGVFERIKGIIFGSLDLVESEKDSERLVPVIRDVLKDFKGPVLMGLQAGHSSPFHPLPLGVECSLEAGSGKKKAGMCFKGSVIF